MLFLVSGRLDSNQRPRAPQTCTLTGLSYAPNFASAKVLAYFEFCKCFPIFLSTSHRFAVEIKHLEDFFLVGGLVDADVAYLAHQREVDNACIVLLVVRHELVKPVVLLAIEGKYAVMVFDELHGLAELVLGESGTEV